MDNSPLECNFYSIQVQKYQLTKCAQMLAKKNDIYNNFSIKKQNMSFLRKLSNDSQKDSYRENLETSISGEFPINLIEQSSFDDQTLIELHKIHGNKWKLISSHYPNKDDSYIKNHFYSLLRKSLRKLNAYIKSRSKQNRQHKEMKLNFIFKLTNLAESEKIGITNKNTYQSLLYDFLKLKDQTTFKKDLQNKISQETQVDQYFNGCDNFQVESLLKSLREIELFFLEHNLNKKGKSKKKCPKKLELKKDIIQRSLSLKQQSSHQNDERFQDLFFFKNVQDMSCPQMEPWEQEISFDQNNNNEGFKSLLDEQMSLDPILFN